MTEPSPLEPPPHLTSAQFRELGKRAVDWVADYLERVERLPVRSPDAPGAGLARLPESPPDDGLGGASDPLGAWDAVFDDLTRVIEPGLTHWQHPSFFGYFPCNASGPAVVGELLSAGLGVQGMLWATSPIATELETRVLDWCAEMFGLPSAFRSSGAGGGVIQGTASEATLCALTAARARAVESDAAQDRCVAYASDQAHSSVLKAAMIAGLARGPDDRERVRLIGTDESGRMRVKMLREAIEADRARGLAPTFVCATMGTTGTGAFDSIDEIAGVVGECAPGAWLHVDGAWAGCALVCPEHRAIAKGIERADSFCTNPHKWLLTNFDCDLFWVRDRAALTRALAITPEYLRNAPTDAGAVVDYRDWQVPLGRRFRALKLWLVIRHYGVEGLRAHIRQHVEWASWIEGRVRADGRFALAAPRALGLVCFRLVAGDAATRTLMDRINASGRAFFSHATAVGRDGEPTMFIRMAIGATRTEFEHVRHAWELVVRTAQEVLG